MDIGKPERVIIVEPLEAPSAPEPIEAPIGEPAPEREPAKSATGRKWERR